MRVRECPQASLTDVSGWLGHGVLGVVSKECRDGRHERTREDEAEQSSRDGRHGLAKDPGHSTSLDIAEARSAHHDNGEDALQPPAIVVGCRCLQDRRAEDRAHRVRSARDGKQDERHGEGPDEAEDRDGPAPDADGDDDSEPLTTNLAERPGEDGGDDGSHSGRS